MPITTSWSDAFSFLNFCIAATRTLKAPATTALRKTAQPESTSSLLQFLPSHYALGNVVTTHITQMPWFRWQDLPGKAK